MLYSALALTDFAQVLLMKTGMDAPIARDTAEILVEGDLLGHSTHGLQLLPRYLDAIRAGAMHLSGAPAAIADRESSFLWDGRYLPGPHLMRLAIAEALTRIERTPVVTGVLRRSGHIACLATYALAVAERGYMILLCCADPAVMPVAPHGATVGRLTPNPIAAGWPTEGDPVFLDICPSSTTAGMVARSQRLGVQLGGPWLVGADGKATSDPAVLGGENGGAILPLGGSELGHKGFALALMVEALTMGLGGFGRADAVSQDGAAVWFQITDPGGFGGVAPFRRETGWTASACASARPIPGAEPVRLPGSRGLALKRRQLAEGISLHPDTEAALASVIAAAGIPAPKTIPET